MVLMQGTHDLGHGSVWRRSVAFSFVGDGDRDRRVKGGTGGAWAVGTRTTGHGKGAARRGVGDAGQCGKFANALNGGECARWTN
jgi:hypothetical protein